ncbi:MAG TPA: tetratricopeptide repeat protein, partial [Sphingobacteriaceae bacterium]|nr:tetratricopeptide repeat protein [Sphingobacteriaceae bacterium]
MLLIIVGTLSVSCAGLRKKDRPEYDMMDNLTSRFNIIHHAKEIISKAEQENRQSYKINYYDLLPVYIEPDEASTARHTSLMDSVLGKAKRVVDEKGKSRFTDDAYFLMAQANYLKGNYHQASAFFAYVANTYPEAKKQRQLAWLGQIRSLMQLGAFAETSSVWDSVFTYLDDHKRTRSQAYATRADYYLKLGDEREALSYLAQALKLRSDREQKLRWHFLMGQLLERQGEGAEAAKHYRKVARSNASYEMAFQAALKRTFLLSAEGQGGQGSNVMKIRALQRMLRDDKNKSFRDQIHYFIAETYVQQGELDEAITHYNHSLREPTGNRHQAAMSFLSLADLYLDQSEYEKARNYYDSTATVLPMDFKDAAKVRRKILNMDRLITNKQVVARQDSLQFLASLDPQSREVAINEIIQRQYAQALEERDVAERQAELLASAAQGRQSTGQQQFFSPFDEALEMTSSSAYTDNRFYFNNPDAVGMGMAAFRRRWGNRPEQDNWRWNDSQQIQQATIAGESGSGNLPGSPPEDKPLTAADSTVAEYGATMTGWESDLLGDSTAFAEWIKQDLY